MSKWADVGAPWADEIHEMPIANGAPERIKKGDLTKHVFGHFPDQSCPCGPRFKFSDDGEYVIVSHRDPERGSSSVEWETLQ